MVSQHEVELKGLDNVPEIIKAKYILIATGGRPSDPGIPGGK
jgi:pyruvate/2-oxoglutarate dehydrogenase complex dihydrolipoamide dehydrogenase (E3) component